MKIIPFSENYKSDVINLILNIQQNEFQIPINIKSQPDLENISNFYQTNNGNFWIAIVDNLVIGTIALLDIENHDVALRKMFVKEEFRGKGFNVGQTLLEKAFEWASTKNIESIYLGTTEKFLAAHRFYEKNGFLEISKNSLPEKFPVMSVDVKFYKFQV